MANSNGKIAQVIGPVVDVYFADAKALPKIYDALVVTRPNGQKVVLETQQHIGEDTVRTVSMDSTDGFTRGQESEVACSTWSEPTSTVWAPWI